MAIEYSENIYEDPYMVEEQERLKQQQQPKNTGIASPQQANQPVIPVSSTPPASSARPWDRTAFRDAWMGSGLQNLRPGDAENWLKSSGWGEHVKIGGSKSDRFFMPGGEQVDFGLAFGAGGGRGGPQWTDPFGGGGAGGAGSGGPGGPGGGPGGGSSGGPGGSFDPKVEALYQELLKRSQQGLKIDRNDPVIRAQADAYSANEERAKRNYLADLAEKSGPLANLRGEQRMSAERMGYRVGGFEAELMGRELSARREEIATALTELRGLLTDQQRIALQKELSLIDDATRRFQIQSQNEQFLARLGLDIEERNSYWNAFNKGLIGGNYSS